MGTSSGADFHHQPTPQGLPPPRPNGRVPTLQTSLSLGGAASMEQVGSPPDTQEPLSNSHGGHDSATESASSRETWPGEPGTSGGGGPPVAAAPITALRIGDSKEKEVVGNGVTEFQAFRSRIPNAGRMTLREVAWERVDLVAEKMKVMSDELLDETKTELRSILEGTGGQHQIQEFMYLQKLVQGRVDLTLPILLMAHHVQLEILVAIKTGIQAFLHPSVDIPQSRLAEIFLYKRWCNIACQSAVPAECKCNICSNRNGFCNLCMCVICSKFDFEVNTCRWVGCDICSHWTHTDCAIRDGQIGTGQTIKNGIGHAEMLFRCQACQRTSELFGWVRDVFQQCAPGWDRDALLRELDYVCKIFRLSEDSKGRKLFRKCAELVERLRSGSAESMSPRILLQALQELDIDTSKNFENEEPGRLITPQEACNRIAEVVQEAVRKMEIVAEEKLRMYKRARLAMEACDRELEEKAREAQELKVERLRKLQQAEELESVIRLKQAEAEMFQLKATEAQEEADGCGASRWRRKSRRRRARTTRACTSSGASRRPRPRSSTSSRRSSCRITIARRQCLPSHARAASSGGGVAGVGSSGGDPSQVMMLSKIQDLLKNVRSMPSTKPDGPRSK